MGCFFPLFPFYPGCFSPPDLLRYPEDWVFEAIGHIKINPIKRAKEKGKTRQDRVSQITEVLYEQQETKKEWLS